MAHWGRYESKITSNYISGGLWLFWGDLGLFWVVWGNSVKLRFWPQLTRPLDEIEDSDR